MRHSPGEHQPIARRSEILLSPWLLVSLAVLVLNDWVLKAAFHNAITGKLSDVAGVAALGLFARALAPRRPVAAAVCSGVAFVFWKSPASQPLIDGWNALGWATASRVVDWTDLVALLVLPWVWSYAPPRLTLPEPLRRGLSAALAAACVLAFGATTLPFETIPLQNEYPLELPADSVLWRIYDLRLETYPAGVPPRPLGARVADTVALGVFQDTVRTLPDVEVLAEIRRGPPGESVLRLLNAARPRETPPRDEVMRWAETSLPSALRNGGPRLPPLQVEPRGRYAPQLLGDFALYLPRDSVPVSLRAPAYVALVEITPEGALHTIYPTDSGEPPRLAAGTHVLPTSCARADPAQPIPPTDRVPPCGVARRATMADAEVAAGFDPPTCRNPSVPAALGAGSLLAIAADAPLRPQALELVFRGNCETGFLSYFPPPWVTRMMTAMNVKRWEMTEVMLRR
jgi:hypothetical protein